MVFVIIFIRGENKLMMRDVYENNNNQNRKQNSDVLN